MLTIEKLCVRYGGIVALNEVDIEVRTGESVLLVGSNGAGKSSLINAVIGLVPTRSGRILLEGQDITSVPCARRARLGIGYSPEGRRVFNSLTVTENILSGSVGIPMAEAMENLDWLIVRRFRCWWSGRTSRPTRSAAASSKSSRSRARSVTMPKLLLLDEPFLGLAPVWIRQISEVIRELQARAPPSS